MTNFLNRIAGRALGVIPLAQPILPARFDPALEKMRPENFAEDQTETSAEHDFAAAARDPLRVQEPASTSHAMTRFKKPVWPHANQPAAFHPLLRTEPHSHGSPLEDREVDGATPWTRQRMHATYVTPESYPDSSVAQSEILRAEDLEEDRSRPRKGAFGKRMEGAMASSVRNPPQQPVRSPASNQNTLSAAPVVRVTIGRIDVRAELASPPVPATRRMRPSVVSLDQFLKQQSEAGR